MAAPSTFSVRVFLPVLSFITLTACHTTYRPSSVQYDQFRIQQKAPQDPALVAMIKPYSDSVTRVMEQVIATAGMDFEKKLPEGTLNNLLADAMLAEASRVFEQKVDAAFVNYGGVRLTQLPAGAVTLNTVFELMPFDNILVLQEVSGTVFQQFLDNIASRGGWPVAGVHFVIRNNKATDVLVGGEPISSNKTYTIANSDYIANGGEDCFMLQALPQQNRGYLVRDGFIHYFKSFSSQGKSLTGKLENRISNAQ